MVGALLSTMIFFMAGAKARMPPTLLMQLLFKHVGTAPFAMFGNICVKAGPRPVGSVEGSLPFCTSNTAIKTAHQ